MVAEVEARVLKQVCSDFSEFCFCNVGCVALFVVHYVMYVCRVRNACTVYYVRYACKYVIIYVAHVVCVCYVRYAVVERHVRM